MISPETVKSYLKDVLRENNFFLVELTVSRMNRINVVVDSMKGITIDECASLSRIIESRLDRDREDFELEVSSPGLGTPFILPVQYLKNRGRQIEVLTNTGQKITGILLAVDDKQIEMEIDTGENLKSKKKEELNLKRIQIAFNEIKSSKVIIKF